MLPKNPPLAPLRKNPGRESGALPPTLRSFLIRHRLAIRDLSLIFAVLMVATFLAFEWDIYANEDSVTRREETIELDEALTLGGLLAVGLLIFAARRYQ